jgi:hypothetical protein
MSWVYSEAWELVRQEVSASRAHKSHRLQLCRR